MKAHELRDLSLTELEARVKEITEEMTKLNFNKAVAGQVENPALLRSKKRELARLLTIIQEKRSGDQAEQSQPAEKEETENNE